MDDRRREIVREVLDLWTAVAPLPPWLAPLRRVVGFVAALVVSIVVVFLEHLDLAALLAQVLQLGAPTPDATATPAPAIPMPEGGIAVPGDPHTGEEP